VNVAVRIIAGKDLEHDARLGSITGSHEFPRQTAPSLIVFLQRQFRFEVLSYFVAVASKR
jgi:hypothetical protein